jgi:hypothetical protein
MNKDHKKNDNNEKIICNVISKFLPEILSTPSRAIASY